jgi:hypothetical protein
MSDFHQELQALDDDAMSHLKSLARIIGRRARTTNAALAQQADLSFRERVRTLLALLQSDGGREQRSMVLLEWWHHYYRVEYDIRCLQAEAERAMLRSDDAVLAEVIAFTRMCDRLLRRARIAARAYRLGASRCAIGRHWIEALMSDVRLSASRVSEARSVAATNVIPIRVSR